MSMHTTDKESSQSEIPYIIIVVIKLTADEIVAIQFTTPKNRSYITNFTHLVIDNNQSKYIY